ncbi:MAG: YggS family pyridoxal phosphate-dependent enzyme [Treponema sp.]|jgi:pyridoxal phosphate enzyme (YggS family)|nr:YggS family pyridoxal phosphate-dependent enzyme [Treponema sp.]
MTGRQTQNTIADRLAAVEERIVRACARAGRPRREVSLMAVSKFHDSDEIREAIHAGVGLFGENRVQEAERKFPALRAEHPVSLHLIGSLQRNKAKSALAVFDAIQSLDRDELIHALVKHIPAKDTFPVLLELHTSEESKSGYPDVESLFRAADIIFGCGVLRLSGLMTMAPFTGNKGAIRQSFKKLRKARDELKLRFPRADLDILSMGMTNDFEIAVEEGATLLRIGTAIFGERP